MKSCPAALSISGGGSFFANDQFSSQELVIGSPGSPPFSLPQDFIDILHGGFSIAAKGDVGLMAIHLQ
jgi:hypothetical protein